jgi:hypothetical protein
MGVRTVTLVITFLIASPFMLALCAWIALDERHDITGHLIARNAWLRGLIARINEYLDSE